MKITKIAALAGITATLGLGLGACGSTSPYAAGKAWAIQDYKNGDIARPMNYGVSQKVCELHAPTSDPAWVAGCIAGHNSMFDPAYRVYPGGPDWPGSAPATPDVPTAPDPATPATTAAPPPVAPMVWACAHPNGIVVRDSGSLPAQPAGGYRVTITETDSGVPGNIDPTTGFQADPANGSATTVLTVPPVTSNPDWIAVNVNGPGGQTEISCTVSAVAIP
jgi:hypothetical protein